MERVLIVADDAKTADMLRQIVTRGGYKCIAVSRDDVRKAIEHQPPHLILVDSSHFNADAWESILNIKNQKKLPVIALITADDLAGLDENYEIDDFIITPCNNNELLLRIKRLLRQAQENDSGERIQCNGLTIDLVTCEVTVDGIKVELTYKEFELLKLMANNRGRVFTREALLDKIWGYDYYGGDRTVDVHMRRLRSKIEDANHTYIETVRNIGYRFIKGD